MSAADYAATVRSVASQMELLGDDNKLVGLNSLVIIELVAALEAATNRDLTSLPLTMEQFRTIDSICDLLERAKAV